MARIKFVAVTALFMTPLGWGWAQLCRPAVLGRLVQPRQEVVAASAGAEVVFREIGPVELKGVAGAIRLHAASRPG